MGLILDPKRLNKYHEKVTTYSTPGVTELIVPAGIWYIGAVVIGAGGRNWPSAAGLTGGLGGAAVHGNLEVYPGQKIDVTVAAAGGTSSFLSLSATSGTDSNGFANGNNGIGSGGNIDGIVNDTSFITAVRSEIKEIDEASFSDTYLDVLESDQTIECLNVSQENYTVGGDYKPGARGASNPSYWLYGINGAVILFW